MRRIALSKVSVGLLFAFAIAAALWAQGFTETTAHAIVDCRGMEDMCKAGTECGWDEKLRVHRCLPVAPAPAPKPTTDAAQADADVWLPDRCAQRTDGELISCLQEVDRHNDTIVGQHFACANAWMKYEDSCTSSNVNQANEYLGVTTCDDVRTEIAHTCHALGMQSSDYGPTNAHRCYWALSDLVGYTCKKGDAKDSGAYFKGRVAQCATELKDTINSWWCAPAPPRATGK